MEYNELIMQQEAEIRRLKQLLSVRPGSLVSDVSRHSGNCELSHAVMPSSRQGKAPPINAFTGEIPEVQLDDWLPSLRRAYQWNDWTEEELLL